MIKALLIDDDLKLAELLENYLRKSDIKLETIADPLDTLPAIRNHNPEVIVLDVMMPKMNGFEVCQPVSYTHLRAHETREDLVFRGLV